MCWSWNSGLINCWYVYWTIKYNRINMCIFINHSHRRVPRSINNSNNILIGLCVINHESFEIWFWKIVLLHHVIVFCPHYLLSLHVFRLHVTNRNGHHFAIGWIVHMTSHNCLTNHMFHMTKHDPNILQIPYKLHSCDKIHSITHTIYGHLENEHLLSKNLSKEITLLDVVISTFRLQFKDVITVTTTWMMLEKSNKVMNIGRAQFT
jgi:hypothetical protein